MIEELEAILDRARDKHAESYPTLDPYSQETRVVSAAFYALKDKMYLVEELSKALRWYANPKNYEELPFPTNVAQDGGLMARVALGKVVE